MSGYSYELFAAGVRQRFPRTECWVCERLLPITRQVTAVGPLHAQVERCRAISAGRVDLHHVIPKQRLKREFPAGAVLTHTEDGPRWARIERGAGYAYWPGDGPPKTRTLGAILNDGRNGVPLRRWHHDELENARVDVPLEALPPGVMQFAAELGIVHMLEREFPTTKETG